MTRKAEKELLLSAVCATFYLAVCYWLVRPILYQNQFEYWDAAVFIGYFFGVTATLLVFHRARWARVVMSTLTFSAALILGCWVIRALSGLIPNWATADRIVLVGISFSVMQFAGVLTAVSVAAFGLSAFGFWILKNPKPYGPPPAHEPRSG